MDDSNFFELEGDISAGESSSKEIGMFADEDLDADDFMKIVYCDRNNTTDIWGDLKNNFDKCGALTQSMISHGIKDYRTVVLLPKME